jgi:NAD(P)H-flavin reductase
MEENIYSPYLMKISDIIDETYDTRTLRLEFVNEKDKNSFSFNAGQFGLYSAFSAGESTFCISSPPTRKGYIECTFRVIGRVTKALMNLNVGDTIGFRGPYGNFFPVSDEFKGKNVLFVAGGIGLAPVRCVIWNVLDLRDDFKDIIILYGARSVADLVYKRELTEWEKRKDVKLIRTVDPGGETPEWDGKIGFVPTVLEESGIKGDANSVAVVCGPPIMIKLTIPVLKKIGFLPGKIYTTLENKMKCGLGKCGRCNVGNFYVCKHGPVITAEKLETLPAEY